jgi:uncharacterized HAD superfamily protein
VPPSDGARRLELPFAKLDEELRIHGDELRIAVDFDGVLFPQSRHVRELFQEVHGIDPGPAERWPWELTEHPPIKDEGLTKEDTWEVFHAVHTDLDRHEEDLLDPHAADVLAALQEAGHRVEIVTARDPESREPTRFFLDRNGIPHDRLVMGDNEKTGWDVLVDDLPPHVERAAANGALGLLHDQPYNRAYESDGNPRRLADFRELAELFGEEG